MLSMTQRVLWSATLVLVVLLGGAGVLIDRAFQDSALSAVQDRLRGRVFLLIGAFDFDSNVEDGSDVTLPDPELSTPGSGHYARILDGRGIPLWSSRSLLGIDFEEPPSAGVGDWQHAEVGDGANGRLFSLSYRISWEGTGNEKPKEFVLQAFEHAQSYVTIVEKFRRSLWIWFAALSVVMLVVQVMFLGGALRPLSRVGEEVSAIEQGRKEQISGAYPAELQSLTRNLNNLLTHNRDNLRRYRNSLGDLAHSIKTPLAILRNEVGLIEEPQRAQTSSEQIQRIDRTVEYYLQRSAAAGRSLPATRIDIEPVLRRIVNSLQKVYADNNLSIELNVDRHLTFAVDEGDLMEVVGNLADNACKWANSRVLIEICGRPDDNSLSITVRDDGPGIPSDKLEEITRRGTRLDESVEGHGIGLAIVREMVESAYQGELTLETGADGTSASARLRSA